MLDLFIAEKVAIKDNSNDNRKQCKLLWKWGLKDGSIEELS